MVALASSADELHSSRLNLRVLASWTESKSSIYAIDADQTRGREFMGVFILSGHPNYTYPKEATDFEWRVQYSILAFSGDVGFLWTLYKRSSPLTNRLAV